MGITRISEFQAKPEQVEALKSLLKSVVEIVLASEGCESAQLLQDHTNKTRFVVIELWAGIEHHQKAAKTIPPQKFREAMELLVGPPTGSYYNVQGA
jgi:quinol monooxygenase YgiN